jgi:uncharacterized repeat protein (TIGR03803 family)
MNERSVIAPAARAYALSFLNLRTLGVAALIAAAQLLAVAAFAGPTLTGLNPNEDYVTGPSKVRIVGSGFSTATQVTFDGKTAKFQVLSDTVMLANVPQHAEGTVDVIVSAPGGSTATSPDSKFKYLPLPTKTTLYKFKGGTTDGASPRGVLVADKAGNLYGVTSQGGKNGKGTVFKLNAPIAPATKWTRTILYHFPNMTSFYTVVPSGLYIDGRGFLYGTTRFGGAGGRGTVYRLMPPGDGETRWTYQLLYTFPPMGNQAGPDGGLVRDTNGVLYGTVDPGLTSDFGNIFQLSPAGTTPWSYKNLHTFKGQPDDAVGGQRLLLRDGALIGNAYTGGKNSLGAVYRFALPVDPATKGTFKLLHSFKGNPDGSRPVGGIVADADGTLYVATSEGGRNEGAVFSFTPRPSPATGYDAQRLRSFRKFALGRQPFAGVVLDRKGALFGTTEEGGPGQGVVFKLTPPAGGQDAWTERVVHGFAGGPDGNQPTQDLLLRSDVIYGTTSVGGEDTCHCGTVFMIAE